MEGEVWTSESDLDDLNPKQVKARAVGSKRLLDDLAASGDSETADEERSHKRHSPVGTKIEWSDDDDAGAAYREFKKTTTTKRAGATAPRTRRSKKATTGVGRITKRTVPQTRKAKAALPVYGEESEDDETIDENLPDYLKKRKQGFELTKNKADCGGLRIPPDFDDVEFSDNERMGQLQEKPNFPNVEPSQVYKDRELRYSRGVVPAPIAQWLREYQVEGAEFLHELFVNQKGGILGDDMGLGKTIQVIACLTAAFGKTGDERDAKRMRKIRRHPSKPWYPKVLLVCPGGLMENWRTELRRWGWWHVDVFHGSGNKESTLQSAMAGRLEIMITTYDTYRLNKSAINMVEWDCVIADECHKIKERKSEITQAMNEINALCRIGLTGTAIQNKYEELWTLLNWTNPGRFGPLSTWKKAISEPLRMGQSHDATVPQLAKARKTAKKLVENLLPQFFLRRMKTLLVDQLPKKSDRVVFCPLTPTQAEAYELFSDSNIAQQIRSSTEPCDCGSGKKKGWCCHMFVEGSSTTWQTYVFPYIATFQKLANHLALVIPSSFDPKDKQDKDLATLQIVQPTTWREIYDTKDHITHYANQDFCGKWKILKKLLRFWHAGGDKVLVFSHSVRLLKMLQLLFNSTTSYNVSYLDGAMDYASRAQVVDAFNADSSQFVFLISTKAGGVGLNITSANKVVVVDPNWNPSWDQQAQDRAYRIGQLRDVEVFRLVSAGTIEEIVYARQVYKQQQANIGYNASNERRYFSGVQENKDKKGEIFGLVNVFSYQSDNVVLRDIVNKTNVAESKAGVSVVGLDVDASQAGDGGDWDDDPLLAQMGGGGGSTAGVGADSDDAMKQLADLVSQGDHATSSSVAKQKNQPTTSKTDAVHAILASAGVEYTHENSEVIGSSTVEARLSRRAEEAGNDFGRRDEFVFAHSQSRAKSGRRSHHHHDDDDDDDGSLDALDGAASSPSSSLSSSPPMSPSNNLSDDNTMAQQKKKQKKEKYNPPPDVRRRQFCSMARACGFEGDVTEFALAVEGWTQGQRRAFLERFYRGR